MEMIGTYSPPCQALMIEENDRIAKIEVASDFQTLRYLKATLASGKYAEFGWDVHPEDEVLVKRNTYNFSTSEKEDIIGAYGWVAPDPGSQGDNDHIVSLGFIVNTCPGRTALQYEALAKAEALNNVKKAIEEGASNRFAVVIIAILVVVAANCACYFILKNRKRLCGGKKDADGPA